MISIDRHAVMSLLLLVSGLAAVRAMLPVRVDPIVQLEFQKNGSAILHLEQGRQITASKRLQIDRMDLSSSGRLRHPQLGEIATTNIFRSAGSLRVWRSRLASC